MSYLFALLAVLMCLILAPLVIYGVRCFGFLNDKDPNDLMCKGMNCTSWEHRYVCNNCMSFTSHDEQITGICLSCGSGFNWNLGGVATRKIVFNGKWVRQINFNGKIYIGKKLICSD